MKAVVKAANRGGSEDRIDLLGHHVMRLRCTEIVFQIRCLLKLSHSEKVGKEVDGGVQLLRGI